MAANKTIANDTSVNAFIDTVEDERKRANSHELIELMRTITGHEPKLWGSSLVGFDSYHYRYASGREGDFFITGFSPRKTALTVYIMPGFDRYEDRLQRLGPHKTGKSCSPQGVARFPPPGATGTLKSYSTTAFAICPIRQRTRKCGPGKRPLSPDCTPGWWKRNPGMGRFIWIPFQKGITTLGYLVQRGIFQ